MGTKSFEIDISASLLRWLCMTMCGWRQTLHLVPKSQVALLRAERAADTLHHNASLEPKGLVAKHSAGMAAQIDLVSLLTW